MKPIYNINKSAAPKTWEKFRRWHPLACPSDPLTAEERFEQIGGEIPQTKKRKNVDKSDSPASEKVE